MDRDKSPQSLPKQLTSRQLDFLQLIVEEFIGTGEAVGSKSLRKKYNLKVSSATIRNDMATLERAGLIIKSHTSAGREPTNEGYGHYLDSLSENKIDKSIKDKLKEIFAKRNIQIESTIDQALEIISEHANVAVLSISSKVDELLKSIQFVPISETQALIIIVTSTANVITKKIVLDDQVNSDDIRIAIRIFNEQLINTPLRELHNRAQDLAPKLHKSIINFEFLLQQFVNKIFSFHKQASTHVYGRDKIVVGDVINSRKDLIYLLKLLEQKSIWNTIENNIHHEDESLRIEFGTGSENAAVISKKINDDINTFEISIVGTKRMNYKRVLSLLSYVEKLILGKKKIK